ncbi:MAG: DUF3306 domain-containing protein [Rhodospirillales bacterium]
MTDDKTFLGRWSQRKTVERDRQPEDRQVERERPVRMMTEPDAGPSGDLVEEPAAEPLPDIESLGKDSDYTGFMKQGVPDHLQKLALRKLWQTDPAFAFRDGLDDYDEDFNLIKDVVGEIRTAYRAGAGYAAEEPETAEPEADDDEIAGATEDVSAEPEGGESDPSGSEVAEDLADTGGKDVPDRGIT